jgi:hypothetical protein
MNRKTIIAISLSILAQLVYADALDECIYQCTLAYNRCLEDRKPLEACQLAQKECQEDCRKH